MAIWHDTGAAKKHADQPSRWLSRPSPAVSTSKGATGRTVALARPRQTGTLEHADHVNEQVAIAKGLPAFAFSRQQVNARTISPSDVAGRVATGFLCWLLNKINIAELSPRKKKD